MHRLSLEYGAPAKVEYLLNELRSPSRLIQNRGQSLPVLWVERGGQECHLGVQDNDSHDVIKVVGDSGCELSYGRQSLMLSHLLLQFSRFAHIVEDQDPPLSFSLCLDRAGRDLKD
jgi:hypothetical protein